MLCKSRKLSLLLGDYDFERRHETGDVVLGSNIGDWIVEETFVSEQLGPMRICQCGDANKHMLMWSQYNGSTDTWVFLYAPCPSRINDTLGNVIGEEWTVITLQKMTTDDPRHGERCFLNIVRYQEHAAHTLLVLNDAAIAYESFCRNKKRWESLYSDEARLARDAGLRNE